MLQIITYNDKKLSQRSNEIPEINDEIKELINEMFKTMYFSGDGVGLAAVQVGVLKRVFIVDIPKFGKYVMINPVITDKSIDTQTFNEGCLSLPGISHDVDRPKKISVEYTDLDGKKKKLKASGFPATCIQHEFDHLEGTLYIDRLPPEIKLGLVKEYKKIHIV